jgi:putative sterol carrier protein
VVPDAPEIDPAAFARTIGSTPDEQLAEGMRSEARGAILDAIFEQMAEHFDPAQAGALEAVVRFRIGGRADDQYDRFQLVIRDGACTAGRALTEDPKVTVTLDAVSFLKLITGNAKGPELLLRRKLSVAGDLMLAAKLGGVFRVPRGQA